MTLDDTLSRFPRDEYRQLQLTLHDTSVFRAQFTDLGTPVKMLLSC